MSFTSYLMTISHNFIIFNKFKLIIECVLKESITECGINIPLNNIQFEFFWINYFQLILSN